MNSVGQRVEMRRFKVALGVTGFIIMVLGGGWDWQSDSRTRQIYVLKQLHNRFAWIGVKVHKVLEELLHQLRKSKSLPSYQSVAENLQNRLRQD